jgi:hypothetical protein
VSALEVVLTVLAMVVLPCLVIFGTIRIADISMAGGLKGWKAKRECDVAYLAWTRARYEYEDTIKLFGYNHPESERARTAMDEAQDEHAQLRDAYTRGRETGVWP